MLKSKGRGIVSLETMTIIAESIGRVNYQILVIFNPGGLLEPLQNS